MAETGFHNEKRRGEERRGEKRRGEERRGEERRGEERRGEERRGGCLNLSTQHTRLKKSPLATGIHVYASNL